jgi:hypothetical protein
MNNQEILDNAPDGATHVDINLNYIKTDNVGRFLVCSNNYWVPAKRLLLRSLADIKRIAELEEDLSHAEDILQNLDY